jgi:hypothetical protein
MLTFVNYPTRFDRRELDAMLKGSGIECPTCDDYAWRCGTTGSATWTPTCSSTAPARHGAGQGGAGHRRLIRHRPGGGAQVCRGGATTIICGTRPGQARRSLKEAKAKGYSFVAYPADIADMADCDRFVKLLIDNHGGVDFLINNAGRSIRRAIESSYDRFHDFERTMQLNYFGCLRVTMGLLPGMVKNARATSSTSAASAC